MATVYDKSSLFLAPSGVNNGTVFAQKPVPIYGSEQVTNGDFSQTGAEEVTNGDFATDSNWVKIGNTSIDTENQVGVFNGVASGSGGFLQNNVFTAGKFYKVSFEIIQIDEGSGGVRLDAGSIGTIIPPTTSLGVVSQVFEYTSSGANDRIYVLAGSGVVNCQIDNISVKEVGQDWTLGTDVVFGNSVVKMNNSASLQGAIQTNVITSGNLCKVSFEVKNYVNGIVNLRHPLNENVSANGVYNFVGNANDTKVFIRGADTTNNFEITNISVQEVLSPDGDFTFTRGSNLSATRVNEAQLIEKGRENLILQSNQFDTTWGDDGGTINGGYEGYDGTNNAWKYTKSGQYDGVWQSGISISGVHAISIYAKLPDGETDVDSLLFRIDYSGGSTNVVFSLTDDGVPSTGGNGIVADKINVGNGWYRCVLTLNQSTTKINFRPSFGSSTGGTSGSIYIQDAQLEQGLAATSVITTGASTAQAGLLENTPRLDYSGGATCPSLLLEPSRSNLLEYSEYFEGSGWTTQAGITLTANTAETLSPEGLNNAYKVVSTDATKGFYFSGLSVTTTVVRTIYLKGSVGGETIVFKDPSGFGTPSTKTLTTDWQRFEMATTNDGNTYQGLFIDDISVGTIYAYGAQLEAGSYATSYIPTYGTSQTRAVDNMQIASGISDLLPQGTGTMYVEATINDAVNTEGYLMRIEQASFANTIFIARSTAGNLFASYRNNNSAIFSMQKNNVANTFKAALAFESGNSVLYVNGEQIDTSLATYTPAVTYDDIRLGGYSANTANMSGGISQAIVFKTRLSNLDLAILTGATTYETFDEMALALNYTVYE